MSYKESIDISSINTAPSSNGTIVYANFAMDIGGSLAKVTYEKRFNIRKQIPRSSVSCPFRNGLSVLNEDYDYCEQEDEARRLCFVMFESTCIEDCLEFIRSNILDNCERPHKVTVKVTGGGALKYRHIISSNLDVTLERLDEMECLVRGCAFMLKNIPDELFYYDKDAKPSQVFVSNVVDTYPFLLVNIGSGVSILQVNSPTDYVRLGGSSIGGGTFWGLGSLLSGKTGEVQTFDQLLALADKGDHRLCDMLIRDIYGGDYAQLGLSEDVIACSFGLAARHPARHFKPEDAAKALLVMVCNNIGQLARLYATTNNLSRVVFGGFFIRGHSLTMQVITYAVNFWSEGTQRALFLRHEGYLGAVGAYLKHSEEEEEAKEPHSYPSIQLPPQWAEVYSPPNRTRLNSCEEQQEEAEADDLNEGRRRRRIPSDSGNGVANPARRLTGRMRSGSSSSGRLKSTELDGFEMDRIFGLSSQALPLLHEPTSYVPDTWDLTRDSPARDYWLSHLEVGIKHHWQRAVESQQLSTSTPSSPSNQTISDASSRADQYETQFRAFLAEVGANPSRRGVLTVRCLLSAQQHFLRECGFADPFWQQKKVANLAAIHALPDRLSQLAALSSGHDRQMSLLVGMLAGDLLHWTTPSNANDDQSNFDSLMTQVKPRPWYIDGFNDWLSRIQSTTSTSESPSASQKPIPSPYKCVLIFCNNSGSDLVLGIIPFALELISCGSKVILAANNAPTLNDVTYRELEILLRILANRVGAVADAITRNRLLIAENGQSSPCLDLRLTSNSLVRLVEAEKVDLVILKGLCRAVHTNFRAKFSVDCIKMCILREEWLASQLGGKKDDVVFKFEPRTPDIPVNNI